MRRAGLVAAFLGACSLAVADETIVRVPAAIAEGLAEGARWSTFVSVEARPSGAVVTLTQTLRPLGAGASLPLPNPAACGDPEALVVAGSLGAALPVSLARRRSGAALEAVEEVVRFVSQAVTADENDGGRQDAASVLDSRRGRCSGRANLAVAILRELGLPARVVHGVLLADGTARLHRWGEVWVGSPGWVAFDPGASVGVVSVRYLPVGNAVESNLAGISVETVHDEGFLSLPLRGGLRVAPATGVSVHCRAATPSQAIMAVLVAPDGSRWARRGRGIVHFDGLVPGLYRLSWANGEERGKMAVLRLGETREVHVNLASAGG